MITKTEHNPYRLMNSVLPVTLAPVDDARLSDLTKSLGLSLDLAALADADPAEIQARQDMIKWLIQNNSNMDLQFFTYPGSSSNKSLPAQSREFMAYQQALRNQETHFWQRVALFREAAQSLYQLPPRVANLLNVLEREGQARYYEELGLVDEILGDLRGVASLKGTLRFRMAGYFKKEDCVEEKSDSMVFFNTRKLNSCRMWRVPGIRSLGCYGAWIYHKALDRDINDLPVPLRERFFNKIRMDRIADFLQYLRWKKLVEPAQIEKTPIEVARDVAAYLNTVFTKANGFYSQQPFIVKVGFSYGEDGLQVCLLDWKLIGRSKVGQFLTALDFGYGGRDDLAGRVKHKQERIARSRETKRTNAEMNEWFLKHDGYQPADAPRTYEKFCRHRFGTVYKRFHGRIVAAQKWQVQIEQAMDDLCTLRNIAKGFEESELPYFYPEISTAQTTLEVTRCYPIRLKANNDGKSITPFAKISVNGQIVNLTGRNGSGKTTAMLSAFDAQLMAQCGLPVFASDATISPRRHILLSFLDRSSSQSTYKAKLEKDMAIIRAIKALPAEERKSVLVIIDELGSATDQGDVLRVVQPLMEWMARQGVSVIMSTQIPQLSKFIGESCRGANLVVQPDYGLAAGIGSGEPYEVARDMGFFKLLNE